MGPTGGFYRFLLLLHIACAILGFGALAFQGLYRARARQKGGSEESFLIETTTDISRIGEYLVYAVFILGILVAVTSKSEWKFSQSWLSTAMALYIVDIGVLHGFVRRSERQYNALLAQANAAAGRTEAVTQLEQLEQRIRLGWAVFDIVFLIILYLMVFTPGHVRVG
jgi:uncharacterized membrane protein